MPTCDPILLSPIGQKIVEIQPKKVLDVGVGTGKWGVLVREYTDIWNKRFYVKDWQTIIHGIEIFDKYRNYLWGAYNDIKICNAIDRIGIADYDYDLIIMTEILEHLNKDDGYTLLKEAYKRTKHLIFSYSNSIQGSYLDNEHEKHISKWSKSDFKQYKPILLCQLKWKNKLISEAFYVNKTG